MTHLDASLFLGFLVDTEVERDLNKTNACLRELFISSHDQYLHCLTYEGNNYLGKYLPAVAPITEIELIETHIISLLRRLLPQPHYTFQPLFLFPMMSKASASSDKTSIG